MKECDFDANYYTLYEGPNPTNQNSWKMGVFHRK